LGAVGTPEGSLHLVVGKPMRPSIKQPDWRALKQREPAYEIDERPDRGPR